jgi:hypothetical protein
MRIIRPKHQNVRWWIGLMCALLVAGFVAWVNFEPGKWLMGWDTLHPEFDFKLNMWRVIHGVWREDQGLGTLAAHAHMSELPRILSLWLMSWLIPIESLRWIYILMCLVLGVVGMYGLISRGFLAEYRHTNRELSGFLGAMFYLGNLGTLQHFYVVFEMFAVAYAAIPWLLWLGMQYARSGRRRELVGFAAVAWLSAPMAYASVLWLVTMAGILGFLGCWGWFGNAFPLKRWVMMGLVVLGMNAYWLAPNLYFLASGSATRLEAAKINQLFSPEAFLQNQAYGDVGNVLLLKNFLFNWQNLDFNSGTFTYLMREWVNQVEAYLVMGWLITAMAVAGLIIAIKQKHSWSFSWLIFTGLIMLVLVNAQAPFAWFMTWVRDYFDLVREALRFPFTKFSLLMMTSLSLGYGMFFAWMLANIHGKRQVKAIFTVVVGLMGLVPLLIWARPMFEGQLISKDIQIDFPREYRNLFTFMASQPAQTRLAVLPAQTPYGWEYFNWGFQGAGFIWFGMPQSVLVRDFDRWSPYNESFYQELSRSIYLEDMEAVKRVLIKYRVNWLLLDKSIRGGERAIDPGWYARIEEKIEAMGALRVWSEGFLVVYSVPLESEGYVRAPESYIQASGYEPYGREDVVYREGDYVSGAGGGVIFPMAALMQEQSRLARYGEQEIAFEAAIEHAGELAVPTLSRDVNITVRGKARLEGNELELEFEPILTVQVDGETERVVKLESVRRVLPGRVSEVVMGIQQRHYLIKQGEVMPFNMTARVGEEIPLILYDASDGRGRAVTTTIMQAPVTKCWERSGVVGQIESELVGGERQLSVTDASACMTERLGGLGNQEGLMLVELPYKGKPHFCIDIEGSEYRCENEEVFLLAQESEVWAQVARWVPVVPGKTYWLDVIARPTGSVGQVTRVTYQEPTVRLYPKMEEITLPASVWQEVWQPFRIKVASGSRVEVAVAMVPIEVDLALSGNADVQNCDLFKRGTVVKKQETRNKKQETTNSITYIARDRGAACDGVMITGMVQSQEYLLRFTGENVSGRSLKFYLFNQHSKRNDLEILLNAKQFDQSFGVLAWPGFDDLGYLLSVENRSFGREVSENTIESVSFYPAPLSWLSQIQIIPKGFTIDDLRLKNNLTIQNVEKFGTGHYEVATSYKPQVTSNDRGLVVLNQGYEKGWKALPILNFKFLIFNVNIPNFFEPYEQVKVNGWGNGWIVEATSDMPQETSQILIFYWPQGLQWGGMGVMGITFLGLLFNRLDRGNRYRKQ